MSWPVSIIPILSDNFVYIIHHGKKAIVIDPGQGQPVIDFLEKNKLTCSHILITHHHSDHVGGVETLKEKYHPIVYAPAQEKNKFSFKANHYLTPEHEFEIDKIKFKVIDVSGHTLGHIAYWSVANEWLFSGDAIFSLGCGRIFEGTHAQTFSSLQRVKGLPIATKLYCAHDYFAKNRAFCESLKLNVDGYSSVFPLSLEQELKYNPFLKSSHLSDFTLLRQKRDVF
ncbi:MAG: hydroxyacylglutathione hydrolase [Bacteriovoracaceae bacterium]|nr:hydroxyacylglutathione hydrolase [Bacteriovoracaceae bacterium]